MSTVKYVLTRESDEAELGSFIMLDTRSLGKAEDCAMAASLGHGPCQLTEYEDERPTGEASRFVNGKLVADYDMATGDWRERR